MTEAEKWHTLVRVLAVIVPIGTLIGVGIGFLIAGDSWTSMATGAMIGFLVTAGIVSFEVSWAVELIPRRWRESPFLVVLLTRSLVWLAIIVVGISLPLITVLGQSMSEAMDPTFMIAVAASFATAVVFNFIGQVNRLLGHRVLVRLILGRYHRPREELRVFLLIDLRGSSAIAERLGNLSYHAFLNRFVSEVGASAVRYRGEVHRYVGDEVILTWTAEEGLHDARCVRAVFAISDSLEAAQTEYDLDFGVTPSFWAGLHLGPVVTGEIGTVKREIAFLGDTLNVAARIEQACKDLQHQFLVSTDVVSSLDLPSEFVCESLGPIRLRGIEDSKELFSVSRAATPSTIA